MAALTADSIRDIKHLDKGFQTYMPLAASKVYKGGLISINSDGYVKAASDTASEKCVGIALETVDNSSGSAGDKKVLVLSNVMARFTATSITQAMLGTKMMVADDQTIDDTSTNSVEAGVLAEFVSTTEGWIYIPPFFMSLL